MHIYTSIMKSSTLQCSQSLEFTFLCSQPQINECWGREKFFVMTSRVVLPICLSEQIRLYTFALILQPRYLRPHILNESLLSVKPKRILGHSRETKKIWLLAFHEWFNTYNLNLRSTPIPPPPKVRGLRFALKSAKGNSRPKTLNYEFYLFYRSKKSSWISFQ